MNRCHIIDVEYIFHDIDFAMMTMHYDDDDDGIVAVESINSY